MPGPADKDPPKGGTSERFDRPGDYTPMRNQKARADQTNTEPPSSAPASEPTEYELEDPADKRSPM
jgi:hypothetical protein